MPIFARTKLLLEERCLTVRPKIDLYYTGPNPQNAYKKLLDILIHDLQVPKENLQEKDFRWDRSSSEEKFSAGMEVIKDFDKFSYMYIEVDVSGTIKPSKEFGKEGSVKITIEARVRTEYPQDTPWERSFIYEIFRMFYHKVFYQEQRKRYVESCRDMVLNMQHEIKSFFNLLPKMGS